MVKEIKAWQIFSKQKYEDNWSLEMFLTGGKKYYSFSEAQHDKRAFQKMSSFFKFKVVRIQ